MEINKLIIVILCFAVIDAIVIKNEVANNINEETKIATERDDIEKVVKNLDDVFNGVYSECFLHLSYLCLQNKTLIYLKELNNLSEVSVIGDYVKFVKLNATKTEDTEEEYSPGKSSDELAFMIDKAIDHFFDNHVIKFTGLRREISMSNNVEEFIGRKKRKGGGGGGGHGGDDGGKKKMMMMAMMCMKMKLMMMVPAMMGMMGMMSFKGMMFSMMSFMVSKMMLLMKILEKKGGAGIGGVGGGGDGGWAAGGGGAGAWMPAGGQDYSGGGYDANGQWQSRSILEKEKVLNKPIIKYVDPIVRYSNNIDDRTLYYDIKRTNGLSKVGDKGKLRVRRNLNKNLDSDKDNTHYDDNKKHKLFSIKHVIKEDNKLKFRSKRDVYNKVISHNNFKTNKNNKHIRIPKALDNDCSKLRLIRNLRPIEQKMKSDMTRQNSMNIIGAIDNEKPNLRKKRDLDAKTESYDSSRKDDVDQVVRKKRSLIDVLQNSYIYWVNKILGIGNRRTNSAPKYKTINGVKYIYYPFRPKPKAPKDINSNKVKLVDEGMKTIITADDFNKGEIMEGGVESRMNRKKFNKMKDSMNDTIDDNPWE